jgi:flagella basal body P-ring formation protein FlgA
MIRLFLVLCLIGMSIPAFAAGANPQYVFQLTYEDAEDAIGKAIAARGVAEKVSAVIAGRKNTPMFSYSQPLKVEIRGLEFDKETRRWSANILFISGGDVISAIPAAGRFDELVELPVLRRQVRAGEVIGEDDVERRAFLVSQTRSDNIADSANLIGKAPARSLSPGRPIREQEIASPAVIKKNALIQMRYVNASIEITATGQALSDGAKGDVIDVRNVASKKIVRAVVENENTANIVGSEAQTASAGGAYAAN